MGEDGTAPTGQSLASLTLPKGPKPFANNVLTTEAGAPLRENRSIRRKIAEPVVSSVPPVSGQSG